LGRCNEADHGGAVSLATIRNPILRDLGLDPDSSLVNDAKARILDYINESIQELNILGNFEINKSQGTVTLATSTSTYALAADADVNRIAGERFYIDSDDVFVHRAKNNQDFQEEVIRNNTGLPIMWVAWKSDASQVHQIKVDPVPTSSENAKTMTYWYFRELSDLSSDSDTTPHQEVIIRHMVKAKYAEYDQDFAKRDREMGVANNLLKKVIGRNRGAKRFRPLTSRNYGVAR
jgi:hypothetical protein